MTIGILELTRQRLGLELSPISHLERLISAAGGFCGIFLILLISHQFVGLEDAALLVASMGASAVLVFAVPHGSLSQPWPVIGGHVVSALVGITCATFIPNAPLAAALAVGLAIGSMHYFRCIHPPGGATALTAVIGGAGVESLGYQFVVTPVLLNVVILILCAVAFNSPFAWRRYPATFAVRSTRTTRVEENVTPSTEDITHADLVYALSEIDSFIDVTESDLLRIYELATSHAQRKHLPVPRILLGHYYSNGKYGEDWSVRQIIDESDDKRHADEQVIFKVVAGAGRRATGTLRRRDFARWAMHEVIRDENSWRRIGDDKEE